jgi:hypothetical protein
MCQTMDMSQQKWFLTKYHKWDTLWVAMYIPYKTAFNHKKPEVEGKGKGHPITGHEGPRGRGVALLILDLGARRGWVVSTMPWPLYPREKPGTHCTGGWVGPRAGLDVRKISPPPGFDPWTIQPVASPYTDWATWPTEVEVDKSSSYLKY